MATPQQFQHTPRPSSQGTPPKKKNWFERNWMWFVPVAAVTVIGLFVGFALLIVYLVFGFIKGSDVYQEALNRAQNNPAVVERLGTPIEPGYFFSGNINVSGASGNADLSIPIHGPKGKAKIYLHATRTAGLWNYSLLVVEFIDTGERLDLLEGSAKDTGERIDLAGVTSLEL